MNPSLTTPAPVPARGSARRRRPPAWISWLLIGSALSGLHYALPVLGASDVSQAVVYCLVSAGGGIAIAIGIRLWRPQAASAWWLFAASQAMFTGGDISYYTLTVLGEEADYSLLPNILYLLQYPLLGLALMVFSRRRTAGRDIPAVIDAAIITVSATLLYWMFLIGPMVSAADMLPMERLATVVFPVMDLLVLTVALRLMFGGGSRGCSYYLLLGFLWLVLLADSFYGMQTLISDYIPGSWVDMIWLAGYISLGAAGLHPSMARLGERPHEHRPVDATGYRLALLASATLVAPMVLVVQYFQRGDLNLLVVACASAILFLLVVARMAGLLAAQRRLASTDVVTGLSTRRSLQERMARESSRAGRRGTALGLLLVDVDHFKRVNDTYGHPAGDEVLAETARRIRASCRAQDLPARFGGEEFAVLVPQSTPEGLVRLAERIRAAVAAEPVTVDGSVHVSVTVSVGGAAMPPHARTVEDLVQTADGALYAAKHSGRNRVLIGQVTGGTGAADRRFHPAA
ncbi:GGDEF domain-containing protein [Planobispora longispora]|uniref:GGDEF domain-containing protein n=1 Tax=Planobispora longispora TaxID=28887 RepID=UPI0019428AC5|nr:GGDEF domain-containing protein [Planobispora longispora]